MSDNANYHRLTTVGKLIRRRAKKTKLLWLSCVPSGKRQNQREIIPHSVCDGETQTTPTVEKSFCFEVLTGTGNVIQMPAESCVVDSSRDSLDSDLYMGSCESLNHVNGYRSGALQSHMKRGNCPCVETVEDDDLCKCPLHGPAIMDKLLDLQQEICMIRNSLSTLKSGEKETANSDGQPPLSVIPSPPPLPPPPPPLSSSPVLHSTSLTISLPTLISRTTVSKLPSDDNPVTQDKGKPIVTLEELQKVKLRQVSAIMNKGGQAVRQY